MYETVRNVDGDIICFEMRKESNYYENNVQEMEYVMPFALDNGY